MENQVRKLRFMLGDALGDYAPDYFRRRSMFFSGLSSGMVIGLGSILAAVGIGFLALRLADKRLGEVIQSVIPRYATNGRKRPLVHGTSGAEMPDADRIEDRRGRMEPSMQEDSDWGGMPE